MSMKTIKIFPSLVAADPLHLAQVISTLEPYCDGFHLDIMDNHFVPNLTIGPVIVEAIRKHTKLPLEAHLMIEHPGHYIENYAKAGADIIQLQAECYGKRSSSCQEWDQWPKEIENVDVPALLADLKKIRGLGKKAFVVFNPGTPLC